jgi:ABC-2 type transport system ATP-binding protein
MRIGTVFGQKSQLAFHLPPADSFRLLGAIYEIPRSELAGKTAELVERFGIGPYMDVPVRKLSLGERIRCEIAASLLHGPRVLFLDEPTIGLDVVVKKEIRELLTELRKREGVTLFLTSHDIGDIEKICKRAIIIHHGSLVLDESMKELKHRALAKKRIGVKYDRPVDLDLPNLAPDKRTADAATFTVDTRVHELRDVMRALVDRGDILDLTVEDEPLEDLIAEVFRGETAEEARRAGKARESAGAFPAAGNGAER